MVGKDKGITKSQSGDLFIVDNSDKNWKVARYLQEWCKIAKSMDIATGFFEIGSLLTLDGQWQKMEHIRILMGDEVSKRTKQAFIAALDKISCTLDASIEKEKENNDFLTGVPAIVEAFRSGKISCRVYKKQKFHAKAYITHGKLDVVGSVALVGSSNFTRPGLVNNVELNIRVKNEVEDLQEWFEEHWNEAEDVTPDLLRTIERHIIEYKPFDVYARAIHELFRRHEMSDKEWLDNKSCIYPILDQYQKDGFHQVLEISDKYRGAFLCDGVGLGKSFIGLMVIEYLIERRRKRVALFVPKSGRVDVWEVLLRKYLPHIFGDFSNLAIFNHTDLSRKGDFPERLASVSKRADAVIVDEAHHFRNLGIKGEKGGKRSRYWEFFDLVGEKTLYMLTATPVNNSIRDLQHMIELFSRRESDYFKEVPLGIHAVTGHFTKMQKALEKMVFGTTKTGASPSMQTNQAEAQKVLFSDELFKALVVQRSRSYVIKSQEREGKGFKLFPKREAPKVADYSIKKTYGHILDKVEQAFNKAKPIFSLAIYYPLAFYKGSDKSIDPMQEGSQREVVGLIRTQFLKRFESSSRAFEMSCAVLLQKLYVWVIKHEPTGEIRTRFQRWEDKHGELVRHAEELQKNILGHEDSGDADEDAIIEEMIEDVELLSRDEYKVDDIINETIDDLYTVSEFLEDLRKFKPTHDDKLQNLIKLLKEDPILKEHKVLIFSEYMATARYLKQQLEKSGIKDIDEIDSGKTRDRGKVIRQFAPYYNDTTSMGLKEQGLSETRILISTDVLSEGLNLQDATRLINYDLHWNPVRLMQRVGRVDRRMNLEIEEKIIADHPDQKALRGNIVFWNFLPPDELNKILSLYKKVSQKTLTISKTFGIEGKKLLTPDDNFEALRNFTKEYEGTTTPLEEMRLEYQKLIQDHEDLIGRINLLPGRVFSGKAHTKSGSQAVFFCYVIPGPHPKQHDARREGSNVEHEWVEDTGQTKWYLYDLQTEKIISEPTEILALIRCIPETPRKCDLPRKSLSEIRKKLERHIIQTYLKQIQAPIGVAPILKAWMELS